MYIYHDLINALNAHNRMIHIKHKNNRVIEIVMLNVHQSVTNAVYIEYYFKKNKTK